MGVYAEATPNPNAMKFTVQTDIFSGDASVSVMPGQTSEHAIMNDLMQLDGVENVFGYKNFITVNKKFDAEWDQVIPKVEEVFSQNGY
jgi:hypothetical protein